MPRKWELITDPRVAEIDCGCHCQAAIVEEEADETIYWLELLIEANIMSASDIENLLKETNEIVAMTVASIKTLGGKMMVSKSVANSPAIQNRKSKIAG